MILSKGTPISTKVRKEKMAAYPYCALCHSTTDLELAHLDPNAPATFDNLMVLCSKCHMEKWHLVKAERRHADMVRRGIRTAKENGVHFGKKPADYEKVMRLIAERSTQFNEDSLITEHEIMAAAGVKEVCYAKCKRMLLEEIQRDDWPYDWEKPAQVSLRPMYEHKIKRLRGDAV